MNRRSAPIRCGGLLAAVALWLLPASGWAVMDDAQSFALEAAEPWVGQCVEIRHDYARGTMPPGGKATVAFQVFKGNHYWFFAGTAEEVDEFTVQVFDPAGTRIEGERTPGNNSLTFHFVPERTMMVRIEVTGRAPLGGPFDWAVVYGFRAGSRPDSRD